MGATVIDVRPLKTQCLHLKIKFHIEVTIWGILNYHGYVTISKILNVQIIIILKCLVHSLFVRYWDLQTRIHEQETRNLN